MLTSLIKHKTDIQKNLVNFPDYGNKDIVFRGLKEAYTPMHPGAAKWFKDNGFTLPDGLKVQGP